MDVQVVGSVGIDGDSTRQRDALDVVFGFFVEIFTECSNVDTFLSKLRSEWRSSNCQSRRDVGFYTVPVVDFTHAFIDHRFEFFGNFWHDEADQMNSTINLKNHQ